MGLSEISKLKGKLNALQQINGGVVAVKGEKGDKGDTGPQGPKGEKGDTGLQGPVGSQGPKGEKGDTGLQGPVGPQGPKGEKGDTGLQGPVGPQGPKGEKGDTGLQGPVGPQGLKGEKGDTGLQGPKGDPGGVNSVNGMQGDVILDNILKELKLVMHPIGCILFNVSGANPSTYIGGTWIAWGSGKVPVGINVNDTDFNTVEKTGGNKELQAHTHSFSAKTDNQSANHTHSIPAHSHGLNNHTHSFSATTSNKELKGDFTCVGYKTHAGTGIVSKNYGNANSSFSSGSDFGGTGFTINASHTHTVSGKTGAATGNSANSSVLTSGSNSANHTHNISGTTASSGNGNTKNLQPYITCYMWKRTA